MGHLGEIRVVPLSSRTTKTVGETKAGMSWVVAPRETGFHALREAKTPGKGFLDTRKVLALHHLASVICSTHKHQPVSDEPNIP